MLTFRTVARQMARHIAYSVLACSLLVGCDDAPPKAPSGTGTTTKAPKAKTSALPPNMVSAVSAGKSSAELSVHFELGAVPAVDRELPVAIAIVPHRPFTSVSASFKGHEALRMSAGFVFEPRKDAAAEAVFDHKIVLLPSQEGVFLVSVVVETEGDYGSTSRIYSIPVIVHGDAAATKPSGSSPAPAVAEPSTG